MKVKKQKSLPYLYRMLQDTICALATASGVGAISVIRLSGPKAISICDKVFSRVFEKLAFFQKARAFQKVELWKNSSF